MNYYFQLQITRIKRWFDNIGIPPVIGLIGGSILFVIFAQLLFHKVSYAALLLACFGLSLVIRLSSAKRNELIHLLFGKRKSQQIRVIENLIVAAPFTAYLMYEQQWWMSLAMLGGSIGLALITFNQSFNLAIPTPYKRLVFEYTVGFRIYLWLIIVLYYIFAQSILVQNFSLSMFCLLVFSLLGMSFLMVQEHRYFIWLYTKSTHEFLLHKVGRSAIAVSVITVPLLVMMLYTYRDQWLLIVGAYILGIIYQAYGLLAKYSSYPRHMSPVQAILFIVSLLFLPLIPLLSISYYRRTEKTLIQLLP